MPVKSPSTRDFTPIVVPAQATEVETTHLFFNFVMGQGYIRQVFTDAAGNKLSLRFLRVTGAKYDNVETDVLAKIQKITDDIEDDGSTIDGVTITEIDRSAYLEATR